MPVTEVRRHKLYESLKTTLGEAEAETFMELIPPTDWTDLATKRDLADQQLVFKRDLTEVRTELKSDITEVRTELKGDIAELRTELKGDIAELRTELKSDIATVKGDLLRTFGTWLFASQAGVVASVALLVGFLG